MGRETDQQHSGAEGTTSSSALSAAEAGEVVPSAPDDRPVLSMVVTSYTLERLADIRRLLDSIKAQTYPLLETVFVADQSWELAEKVQEHAMAIELPVRVLLNTGEAGVNLCRNMGILAARGDIVGLVDDDTVLLPDWAEQMVKTYVADPSVVAVTGPVLPLWDDEQTMSWFPREFYWMWGCTVWDWQEDREIRNVGGMNCSFRKDTLVQVGLYRTGLGPRGGEEKIKWFHPSGEEVELCIRMRRLLKEAKIMYNPRIKVYHKVQRARFTWGFMIKRAFRFGYSKHYVEDLFGNDRRNGRVLDLEREHLRHILWEMPHSLCREFVRSPRSAWRKFLVACAGTLFTGLGYWAYFLKPAHLKEETT